MHGLRFYTCLLSVVSLAGTVLAREADKPNIVYIMADDLGYGDIGSYGQKNIKTPRLDQMAAEGKRYTQFYSGSTVCAPSRAALLTGLHMGHTVVRGNGPTTLTPEPSTLGELLKFAGYRTSIIGKWGMGGVSSEGSPMAQGFDEFVGYAGHVDAHNHYPDSLYRNDQKWDLPEGTYSHDVFTTEARNFIRRNKENPFFLYLAYTLPHSKLVVPSLGQYATENWPAPEKAKAAMITRLDSGVGEVLDELKAQGLDDNTIVVFTSDNGPHKEGGNNPEFHNSNGPLRGIKRDLTEGGIRVPMIVRWPGKVQPSESDQVWANWDMLPTLLDIIGEQIPEGRDGISLKASILENKPVEHGPLYWEFYERGFHQAVRKDDWKLIKTTSATLELYDLSKDIGEAKNLAPDRPEVIMELMPLLTNMRTESERFKISEANTAKDKRKAAKAAAKKKQKQKQKQ